VRRIRVNIGLARRLFAAPGHLQSYFGIGASILSVAILSSCALSGRDVSTGREYTPARGANDRDADIDVLGAVVVSADPGSGTLVASFVNNLSDQAASITTVRGGSAGDGLRFGKFEPIEIPPLGLVNLAADDRAPRVRGSFKAGEYVELTLVTDADEVIAMEVPVVPEDYEFTGLDTKS
jgi:hypothetical protein